MSKNQRFSDVFKVIEIEHWLEIYYVSNLFKVKVNENKMMQNETILSPFNTFGVPNV